MISIAGHFIPWRQCCSTYITTRHCFRIDHIHHHGHQQHAVRRHLGSHRRRVYVSGWTVVSCLHRRCPASLHRHRAGQCCCLFLRCAASFSCLLVSVLNSLRGSVCATLVKTAAVCILILFSGSVCATLVKTACNGLRLDLVQCLSVPHSSRQHATVCLLCALRFYSKN